MKGLIVTGDGLPRLVDDIPEPQCKEYDAIVKTIACGICNGTDLKLAQGHLVGFSTYPAVLGHESVGRVVAIGKNVRNYKIGDLTLRSGLDDSSKYHSLWGSFAEYTRVVDYWAMKEDGLPVDDGVMTQQVIPSSINPEDGVMIITLKEVHSALRRLGLHAGARVAIAGCGPVGISMVRFCKIMGASFVALSGHHDDRLSLAEKMGADVVINSKKHDLEKFLQDSGQPPLDFYIDAVGRCSLLSQALRLIKDDGTIGLYGIGLEVDRPVAWYDGPYNFRIHSVQWPIPSAEAAVHEEVIRFIENGQIRLADFVSHKLPVEEYEEGFRLISDREGLKVALYFDR